MIFIPEVSTIKITLINIRGYYEIFVCRFGYIKYRYIIQTFQEMITSRAIDFAALAVSAEEAGF